MSKSSVLRAIAIRPQKYAPMKSLDRVVVGRDFGLEGDSRGRPSVRQVTLLSAISWAQVCDQYGQILDWRIRRANLLIEGFVFSAADIGRMVTIANVVLEITKECDPCYRMDDQVEGLQKLLKPAFTAGVCARVISGGQIEVGADVVITPAPEQGSLW